MIDFKGILRPRTIAGLILLLFRETSDSLPYHTFVYYRCNGSLGICVLSLLVSFCSFSFIWLLFVKIAWKGSSWPKHDAEVDKQAEIEREKEREKGCDAFWWVPSLAMNVHESHNISMATGCQLNGSQVQLKNDEFNCANCRDVICVINRH